MTTPTRAIVESLLRGDASCLTQDAILNINQLTVMLINKEPLTTVEQAVVDDILHISNIIYNNTDRSILVLEDGVYDLLLEKYKRYNPNFQVGAEPIHFSNFDTSNNVQQTYVEEINPEDKLFVWQPYVDTKNFMFRDCLANRTYFGNAIIDNNVKTVSKRLRNIKHSYPQLVGTLHKAKFTLDVEAQNMGVYDDQNVRIFERDFLRKHVQDGVINPGYIELVLELKYDGVSIEAEVTDKVLSAKTRGDTQQDKASDLSPILRGYTFPNAKGYDITPFGMKFEAVISYDNLQRIAVESGKIYKNARNAIIGILGNSEAYKYAKYITLVPLQTSHDNMTREEELLFMNKYYATKEPCRIVVVRGTYDQVLYQVQQFVREAEAVRDAMPFMYDGVVVSYLNEDIRKYLGRKNSINEYSIAIKFQTKKKLTRFRGYSYTVGANGDITPMIHYDPIEFYGMINTKSSGHSYARFNELGLRPNDVIEIEYTNDVMAYVRKAMVEENVFNPLPVVPFITHCPECGNLLVVSPTNKSITCTNIACPGRSIARLTNMVKKLGFKGFSEETVRTLGLTSFYDLMTITEERASVLGPNNAINLIKAVEELYNTPYPDFILLGSLGFSDIAEGKWKTILKKVTLADLVNCSGSELFFKLNNSGKGIGPKTSDVILRERDFFKQDLAYIYNMPNVVLSNGDNSGILNTSSKVIRFSGIRDEKLIIDLTMKGHDISDGAVTKTTDFLLIPNNIPDYSSGKVLKAIEYNTANPKHEIKIIPLDEFKLNMSTYLSQV